MTFPDDVQFMTTTAPKNGKIPINHLKVDVQRNNNSFCRSSRKQNKF